MKKVVVTGANGFVGAAICKELSKAGVIVIAIVRDETSNIKNIEELPGVRIVYCDLSRISVLDTIIQDRDIDVFYHLAWAGAAGTERSNYSVQLNNVKCTCDAVEVCHALKCQRFIFAASIMEYEVEALMKMEREPEMNAIYSTAKLAADYMARTIAGVKKIEYIRAVISNIYGPGENSPRLINASLRKLLLKEYCRFSSGDQMYDFIYISDAAKVFIALGEHGIGNRTYYVGSLNPRPLKEFLYKMRDVVNPTIEIGLGEVVYNGASIDYDEIDIEAVKRDTGFEPQVEFSEGIRKTIEWLKEDMCQNLSLKSHF